MSNATITLNNVTDGIVAALNTEFGDSYEIYTEDVQQYLTEPCFSIVLVRPSQKQFLGKRYIRKHFFCIHYFPQSKDEAKYECNDVSDRLMDCLEYIEVDGDVVRGTEMESNVEDGVLNFFVNYNMFVTKEAEGEPAMETIAHETQVKG